jgi:hypothetical protein
MSNAVVGTRIFWPGNFGAVAAYGTIVEVAERDGMVKVAWDKGSGRSPSWELAVLVGLPSGFRVVTAPVVEKVSQTVRGRHVRYATRVTFADGRCVTFTERVARRTAVAQAEALLARGYSEAAS